MQRQQFTLLFASLQSRHRPDVSSPNALPPNRKRACVASAAVQMWATCNPGTAALVSRVPYEPSCPPALFASSEPSRGGVDGALSSSAGPPKMKGHFSPERAALPSLLEKNAVRTPWHVHPSVNPSSFHVSASMLWQPFV